QQKLEHFKKEQNSNTLSSNLTTTLYLDRTKNLWIGTDGGGVCRLNTEPPLFNIFPHRVGTFSTTDSYFTKCFYEDEQKNIWFGTANSGFGIYHAQTGALKLVKYTSGGKPITNVGSIFKD